MAGGVLLASCAANEKQSSSSASAQSSPSSSQSTSVESSESTKSDSSSSSSSSESSSSSSSSESSKSTSTEQPPEEDEELTSWTQITSTVYAALKEFTEEALYNEEGTKTPDACFPVPALSKSIAWDFDPSMNYSRGIQIGMVALTGTNSNDNKAIVAAYNALLVAGGYKKLSSEEIDELASDYYLNVYSTNVYEKAIGGVTFELEVVPVADIEADGMITFPPADADNNPFTQGIFISIQPKEY